MEVKIHKFPTLSDGRIHIEEVYCELLNKYRSGEELDPEEIDWMDTANNWLTAVGTKL